MLLSIPNILQQEFVVVNSITNHFQHVLSPEERVIIPDDIRQNIL